MLIYKGYLGHVTYDDEAGVLHGDVVNLRLTVITFQGQTVEEVKRAFVDSVDDYLTWCQQRGVEPEAPLSAQVASMVEPDVYDAIHARAKAEQKSVDETVASLLKFALEAAPQSQR